ncbi:hypothetical protein CPB83DRAFT_903551 [Crepidotus variabilis]|uniref:Uncharacterized protein n=1 Tax=Crepidotus variabilis TaxID=179855 RepID=A0A9P6EPG8_9AGAR|nr:hypothetical protein CPB83DRAFT_903551 [Crepidotus variabilis]
MRYLVYCKFAGVDADTSRLGGAPTPVHATALYNLESDHFFHEFWDLFTFPNSRILQFHNATGKAGWSRFHDFLTRSACQLLDLQFTEKYADEEEVVETLKLTPHLETLSVEGTAVTKQLFSLMDTSASSTGNPRMPSEFLSRLKSLHFGPVVPDERVLLVLLANIMRSRPNARLKTLTLKLLGTWGASNVGKSTNSRSVPAQHFRLIRVQNFLSVASNERI